jgi:hypothetical protein
LQTFFGIVFFKAENFQSPCNAGKIMSFKSQMAVFGAKFCKIGHTKNALAAKVVYFLKWFVFMSD